MTSPRHHLALSALLLSAFSLQAFSLPPAPAPTPAPTIIDTTRSPHATLRPLPYDAVQFTTGFWADRYHQLAETTLDESWRLLADPKAGHVLDNFRSAALPPGAAAPTVNSKPKTVNPSAAPTASGGARFAGTHWQDEWLYKWIEAASCVLRTTQNPDTPNPNPALAQRLRARIAEAIPLIAAAQQPDGYISTNITTRNLPRFTEPREHEIYNMGHLITAGVIHRRMTADTALYDIALRAADYLCANLGITIDQSFAHNPSAIMGLIELYRDTRDKKYLDCAARIIDGRGANPKKQTLFTMVPGIAGTDVIQDRVPIRESSEIVGHNVFFTYLYTGAADLLAETGDPALRAALDRLWADLTRRKMYIHGGVSARHIAVSNFAPVIEAAGAPYELPNTHCYNETCGQIGVLMWAARMNQLTPDSRYPDIMEREMYNGFLPAQSLDGKHWFYRNIIRRYDKNYRPAGGNDMAQRGKPGRREICCPSNLLRTLAQLPAYLYSTDDTNALWIHHYASSRAHVAQAAEPARSITTACHPVAQAAEPARSTLTACHPVDSGDSPMQTAHNAAHPTIPPHHPIPPLTIEQITDYPWNGDIRIHIKSAPPHPVTLHLRIPAWAANPTLAINDQPVTPLWSAVAERSADTALSDTQTPTARQRPTENREPQTVNPAGSAGGAAPGYATITRTFHPGDTITLTLPMPVQLIAANPLVEETRNQAAVMRGPVLYCLESPDLPDDIPISQIHLSRRTEFTPEPGIARTTEPLAQTAISLKTTAHILADSPDWADTLYRPLAAETFRPITLRLIPYYAWSNRGPSAMTVWLPLAWQ